MDIKKRKRTLSIAEKYDIINLVNVGNKSKTDIAKSYDIPLSTLSTFLKNKDKIVKAFEEASFCPERKRIRIGNYTEVENCLHKWLTNARSQNIPISGNHNFTLLFYNSIFII